MSQSDSEGFLNRWSRRKRAAVSTPPPAPEPPAEAPAEALPEFDPASLPPIESLTADSDIAAFLRPQVPAALRTAALRRAWTLDPAIRDYVGPADYAWDYNAADGMAGFSLELGGDVKRLLAQAIGLVEEEEKPPGAPPEGEPAALPDPPPSLVAEPPRSLVAEPPRSLVAEPPRSLVAEPPRSLVAEPPPSLLAEPLTEPPAVTLAEAVPGPAAPGPLPPEPAAPPPRRHGGARPV
jgi:hypothetical protein